MHTRELFPFENMHIIDPYPENEDIVLLLHGLGSEGSSWELQFGALGQAGFRPIALDLPGFGSSPAPSGRWSLRNITKEVGRLVRKISPIPIPVVGISMGGVLALNLAIQEKQLVERLVLINAFACLWPKRLDVAAYLLARYLRARSGGPARQAELVAERLFPKQEQQELREILKAQILKADPSVYRAAMQELALFNVQRKLEDIQVPVLVVSGERDNTVPLENQTELAQGIPGARHLVVPDAGHAAIVDQPAMINDALIGFLRS